MEALGVCTSVSACCKRQRMSLLPPRASDAAASDAAAGEPGFQAQQMNREQTPAPTSGDRGDPPENLIKVC